MQAEDPMDRSKDGIGLGLTICKKLIDQLEGEISVTSELGKGTTFIISLKLDDAS